MENQHAQKMSVILISPDLEKLHAGALVGSVAAAAGMEVNLFVTMGALQSFLKTAVANKNFTRGSIGQTMLDKEVPLFYNLLQDGKDIGELSVYACAMAMDLMEWEKGDLLEIVDDVIGITAFLNMSQNSQVIVM
ncbi:DsrE/DsrF/DrsH-like family protein [Effusibacillus lacus]|uniref:Peroxiredoxin n=1 Tax=Effusibacillus lacus TaxID=1348429 RepID=A0A292YQQ0_9BACL|nr:DsrE/DsrF/DrsH-like family protein [Effusibacillus lacus]TCS76908.1 peroxiredoxin family protein [Effusibacillus lacus]GAX91239.1 hypothetical protein EFBL_2905 [Effusibacillus lacus]